MPNPCRLAFRYRAEGFLFSRLEFLHRELRDFYRTRLGFLLVWSNIVLLLAILARRAGILPQ